MKHTQFKTWTARAGVLAIALTSLHLGLVQGAEKIRFTEGQETSPPPGRGLKEGFRRDFEVSPSGPVDSDMAPPPPPAQKKVSPKIEEWLDQKKNWIFNTPSKNDQGKMLNEIFNVREHKFEFQDQKRKTTIERYFERDAETRREIGAKTGADDDGLESANTGRDRFSTQNSGTETPGLDRDARPDGIKSNELSLGTLMRGQSRPIDSLTSKPGELLPRGLGMQETFGSMREGINRSGSSKLTPQEQRMQDFQKLLDPARVRVGLGNDPINAQADSTRQPLNPVVGQPFSEGVGGNLAGGLNASSIGALPITGARPGLVDSFNPRATAGPALGSSLSMPSPLPTLQGRPPVLEIPRRKF